MTWGLQETNCDVSISTHAGFKYKAYSNQQGEHLETSQTKSPCDSRDCCSYSYSASPKISSMLDELNMPPSMGPGQISAKRSFYDDGKIYLFICGVSLTFSQLLK